VEETPPFTAIVEADELVHPVVVLADGGMGGVGLGDDRELVVGVLAPSVVSDLQNPATVVVIPVAAQDASAFADLTELVADS
jgi:hypothetical protein